MGAYCRFEMTEVTWMKIPLMMPHELGRSEGDHLHVEPPDHLAILSMPPSPTPARKWPRVDILDWAIEKTCKDLADAFNCPSQVAGSH
jgi:hypothetical protein